MRVMGNYRFKLSDMMPYAWFYKLREMGRRKKKIISRSKKKKQSSSASTAESSKPKQTQQCSPRKSYYFTRELNPSYRIHTSPANNPEFSDASFPEPPRKSSKQRPKRRTSKLVSSSVSAEYSSSPFGSSAESECAELEFRTDRVLPTKSFDEMVRLTKSIGCRLNSNANDIVIDVEKNCIVRHDEKLNGFDSFSEFELPMIKTKPYKFNDLLSEAKKKETKPRSRMAKYEEPNVKNRELPMKVKILKEDAASIKEQRITPVRRFSVSSPGVKLRINSPRMASRKVQIHGRKSVSSTTSSSSRRSLSDSLAIVKSSFNPKRDFRESMVEMIVEHNIRASKDLEDLLACYLYLNSDEYHDLIVQVFKQIWFDLTDTPVAITS